MTPRILVITPLWGLLWALLLAGCGASPEPGPKPTSEAQPPLVVSAAPPRPTVSGPPRLLVLSSLNGYLEPCGCTVDLTLGGIDRTATVVSNEQSLGPTVIVVVGPTLFDPHVTDPHLAQQEATKARTLVDSLRHIGVDAIVPTAGELKYGGGVLDAARGDWTWPDATVNVPGGRPTVKVAGDATFAFLGFIKPGDVAPGGTGMDPEPAAREALAALSLQSVSIRVGLSALSRRETRVLARALPEIDLWVLGDRPAEEAELQAVGDTYLVEAGDRGRHLGRLVLHGLSTTGRLADPVGERSRALRRLDGQLRMARDVASRTNDARAIEKVAALEVERKGVESASPPDIVKHLDYTLLPIGKGVVPEPALEAALLAYNVRLKEVNLASDAPPPPLPEGGNGYAGGKACVECHEDAQAVWLTTPHARAWKTLVDGKKSFDAECVSCHVTGWRAPGGVNLTTAASMGDVQCEACHGPSAKHVDLGGDEYMTKLRVAEAVCKTCHNEFHSPKFDFATYLPKVLGKGHTLKN